MNMNDFPKDMQKLLLKKEQEYGKLKFIASRATEETSCFIDELLEAITNIAKEFSTYNVQMYYKDDFSKPCCISPCIIYNYNYFVLNTNFSSQSLLAEDMLHSNVVNAWPTLSPYLFIQMIWHMKCEDLLIESLMHLPLDLCLEILEITIRCINELEIQRAKRIVFLLIAKLYYKCLWLHLGTLSKHDVADLVDQLIVHFQALLTLASSKFVTLELCVEERHVQHGILLKDILRYIETCMCYKTKTALENYDILSEFKITYGRPNCTNYFYKLPIDKVKSTIATLDQELVALLLNEIKQVDCFEFMDWAEVDDEENVMISLQRAIIIECYYFIEFMKHDEFLLTNEDLFHCLQQLVCNSSNSEESILTLQELCDSIANGKLDGMKELIKHYKKWDLSTLSFISKKTELLNKEDVGILLEYLHYMFGHTQIYKEKHQAYILVLKVLIQQSLLDMYFIIVQYTLRHFYDNRLTCLFDDEHFKTFIESNINMRDHQRLRIILMFIMLSPKKVLTTLVKVAIGSTKTEYRNIIFKRPEIYFLYAFFVSRLNDQTNLLTYLLNDIWLHDRSTWCYKQFEVFLNDMLQEKAVTPDDLLNNVYIPCLTNDVFNCSNLLSVLIHMYSVLKKRTYTDKTNHALLIIELTKKMSMIRKCNPIYLRSTVNNLLDRGTMILNFLYATPNLLTLSSQNEIINKVNNFVEPIDQILMAPLLQTFLRGTVNDVIQNYERRCLVKYQLLCANSQCKSMIHDHMHSFQLDRKALLRHMMLHATEEEYKTFALEITTIAWSYFGWANELVAYKNILHITAEAMQLALIFIDTFPKDTFVSLLRALVHYCNALSYLKHQVCKNQEAICNTLSRTLSSLKNIVNETQYGKTYDYLLADINNMHDNINSNITVYFRKISELIDAHFVQSEETERGSSDKLENESWSHSASTTSEIVDMFKAYQFVCKCIDLH